MVVRESLKIFLWLIQSFPLKEALTEKDSGKFQKKIYIAVLRHSSIVSHKYLSSDVFEITTK